MRLSTATASFFYYQLSKKLPMTIPFGEVPEAERDEQIGFWWKDRLELLVDEQRPKDARALYLEFENDLQPN
jgi:hypothetical protein